MLIRNYVGWDLNFVKQNLSLDLRSYPIKDRKGLLMLLLLNIVKMELNSYAIMIVKKLLLLKEPIDLIQELLHPSLESIQPNGLENLPTVSPLNIDMHPNIYFAILFCLDSF